MDKLKEEINGLDRQVSELEEKVARLKFEDFMLRNSIYVEGYLDALETCDKDYQRGYSKGFVNGAIEAFMYEG